ncbi:hypothetical protein CLIB1444_06S01772 [[Candida] jaroonii]|uniref:Uncharacterized protein n=1 Tax=[Candida] jaroonii TaxID=467808 RepID=A0ACA9Y9J2_9ASCO|nr:hypothetical protein CLIB1444_06S01772 [[Candida] jaroonii]
MNSPLPLIPCDDPVDEDEQVSSFSIGVLGYMILFASWLVFVISCNTFFEIWRYVILPLKGDTYETISRYFEVVDAYVFKFWNVYVVIWWWAIISWTGLKLFRHSKGTRREKLKGRGTN